MPTTNFLMLKWGFIYLESQIYEYYNPNNKYAYLIVITLGVFFFDSSIANQLSYKTLDNFLFKFQTEPTIRESEKGSIPLVHWTIVYY